METHRRGAVRFFNQKKWVFLAAAGIALCLNCAGAKHKPSESCGCGVTEDGEGSASDEALRFVENAAEFFRDDDFDQAIHNASEAIKLDTDGDIAARAYYLRALSHSRLKNYEQAVEDCNAAVKLADYYEDNELATVYTVRADAYLHRKKYEEVVRDKEMTVYDQVIQDASEAIRLAPEGPNAGMAYSIRSKAYYSKDVYDKALEDCTEAISRIKGPGLYFGRAAVHSVMKNYDQVIEDATAEIQMYPDGNVTWGAYLLRSDAHTEKGNYDLAIEDLSAAILIKPDEATLYNSRAWKYAHYMKSNFDRAVEDADKAIELQPNKGAYYDTRGWAYLGKGDYDGAERDFTKALQIDPDLKESKEGMEKVREAQAAKQRGAATKAAKSKK
jgi:tetratricopeptide (TPR) repeat protein